MSAELPLSTKTFLITHPAMFTLMTMASLWFVDFNKKSSLVIIIGTLAHSGRAVGPSLMTVFTYLKVIVPLSLCVELHG
jgi:hypothetical protein